MANNEKSLTPKQEKFVQRLFAGDSQREAYKTSYDCKSMKDKTVDERACVLAGSNKIKTRLKELQEITAKEIIWDKERSIKELSEIVLIAKEFTVLKDDSGERKAADGSLLNAATKAIAEINSVLGLNAPKKVDAKISNDSDTFRDYVEAIKNGKG